MNKLKFIDFLKTKNSLLTVQIFFSLQYPPHFPLKGNVGQLKKRKRVLCWSIFFYTVISFWL